MIKTTLRCLRNPYPWCCRVLIGCCILSVLHFGVDYAAGQLTVNQLLDPVVDNPLAYPDVEQAITRFRNGDINGARQLLEKAARENPELPPGGVLLGRMLLTANQSTLARATLENVVKTNPDAPEPSLIFGQIAFSNRRYTDAGLLFQHGRQLAEAISTNPKRKQNLQVLALSGLASVSETRGNWERANTLFEEMKNISPNNPQIQTGSARVIYKLGRVKEAADILNNSWRANPSGTRPEITMGRWYQADGKDATQLFRSGANNGNDDLGTQLAVARWGLETGNIGMATTSARRAIELAANSTEAHIYLGLAARFQKDFAAAESAFTKAHVLAPSNSATLRNLALSLVEQVDDAKRRRALEYAQMNTRLNSDMNESNGREAAITLGWVLFKMGRESEALRLIQRVTRVDPTESAYFAARIYQSQGQNRTARQLLQAVLRQPNAFPTRDDAEALLARLPQN